MVVLGDWCYSWLAVFSILVYPFTGAVPNRTPESFDQIFIARCNEYQQVLRPELFQNKKNCTHLWELFIKSFKDKDPCDIKPEDYQEFLKAADHEMDTKDKTMYWSGTGEFVIPYTTYSKTYTTIRDQLAVFILKNTEIWCGQISNPGINYQNCPESSTCPKNAIGAFWKQMSKNFAARIRGTVHVILNASVPVAFRPESIFALDELPNLHSNNTPTLFVHLVSNLGSKPIERCDTGSLLELKKIVEKKQMKFLCELDDKSTRYFQCIDITDPKLCPGIDACPARSGGTPASISLHNVLLIPVICFIMYVVDYSKKVSIL